MQTIVRLQRNGLATDIARLIRESRLLIGWSQLELAQRADTSQAMVSRIERNAAEGPNLAVVERLLSALGLHVALDVRGRHLDDRQRQVDAVHAVGTGYVGRRLTRLDWRVASEVELGDGTPRGWIDLLAFRERDASLLIEETKTEITDGGALLRQIALYERDAWTAARRLGWQPRRAFVLVALVDTERVADRVVANRELLRSAFPGSVAELGAWLRDASCPAPRGRTLATIDPRRRGKSWLHASHLGERRTPAAFVDYADAARQLCGPSRHSRLTEFRASRA